MKEYLLIDEEGTIPLTKIIAETEVDALCKAIKNLIMDDLYTFDGVCEDLGIEFKEILNIPVYE